MSWASKRQFKYLMGIFGVFTLIIFWMVYPMIFKKATCSDGKQNGEEKGIDCGGACFQICPAETALPVTVWSRAFPVTGSIYNLVAYVENSNKAAAISIINYEFKIYDRENRLIGRREGSTFIPPNQQFAVFESRFDSGQSQIKSVSFEFLPPYIWQKKEPLINILPIRVSNIIFENNINLSSLRAQIKNDSIYNIPAFDVVAILYDIDGNAINVSKTTKEGINSNGTSLVTFTWPEAFLTNPVTNDVLVQINPFSVSF